MNDRERGCLTGEVAVIPINYPCPRTMPTILSTESYNADIVDTPQAFFFSPLFLKSEF